MTRQSRTALERAWVEIDLGALRQNAATIARRAGVPILPMIKADAYGLGAGVVARALEPLEPWGYGLATVAEGEELRACGITRPLLICTPLLPVEFERARAARLTPSLGDPGAIETWIAGAGAWHLSIDTGMSRAGLPWHDIAWVRELVQAAPPEGAFTHFHSADRNDGSAMEQERRFREAVAALPSRPRVLHTENSAALQRRGASEWDIVRPGVALYGVSTGEHVQWTPDAVVAVRACIAELRSVPDGGTVSYGAAYRAVGERRIATIPLGYADGYRRSLSNRGTALLRGRRVPVAGVVTMDMTMIDVTGIECEIGDIVTLIGRETAERLGGERDSRFPIPDPGSTDHYLSLERVAWDAEMMSPYELLTGLRTRLPRIYRPEEP